MSRSKDPKALGSWLSKPLHEGGSASLNASKTINTVSTGVSGGSLSNPSNHSSVSAEKSRQTIRSANSSRRSLLSMPEEFSMNAAPVSPLHSPSCRSARSKVTNGPLYPSVPEVSEHEEDILWEHPLHHEGAPTAASRPTASSSSRSTPRRADADIVLTHAVNKSPPRLPKKKVSTTTAGNLKAPPPGFAAPAASRRTEYDLSGGLHPSNSSRHFVSPLPLQTKPTSSSKSSSVGLGSVVPQSIVVQKQVPSSSKSGIPMPDLRRDYGVSTDLRKPPPPPPQEIVLDNKFWQNQTRSKTRKPSDTLHQNRMSREHRYHDDGYDESMSRASSRLQGSCTSINYDQSDRFDESEASALAAQEEEMMLLALELSLADQNSSYQLDFNDSGDGCSLSVPSMRNGGVKSRGQKEPPQANLDSLASGKTYYVCIPQQTSAPGASVTSSSSKGVLSSHQREPPLESEGYCGDSVTSHRFDDRSFLGREDMTMNSDEEREMIELAMERSLHDGDSVSQLSRPEVLRRDVSLSTVYLRNDLGTSDGAMSSAYAQAGGHDSRSEPQPADVSSSRSERSYYGHHNSTHSRDLLSERGADDVSHGSRYSMRDARWAAQPPSMRRVAGSSSSRQAHGAGGSSGHSRQTSGGYLSGIDHDERYRLSDRPEPYRLDDDSEYQRIASYAQPASVSKSVSTSRHSSKRGGSTTTRPTPSATRGPPSSIGFYAPTKPSARSSTPTDVSDQESSHRRGSSSRANFTSIRAKFDKGSEGPLPDIVVRNTRPPK